MIEIGIDPVVAVIGGFELRWYGIIVAIAVIVAVLVSMLRVKEVGATREQVLAVVPWAIVGGIVFSRLLHVIDQWHHYYPDNLWGIFGFEGMTIFGVILGGTLVGVVYIKLRGFPVGKIDLVAPGAILAQAVGRVGCIINGCCYGTSTSLPWAVLYTHPDSIAYRDGVTWGSHPTQAYELLWDLVVFGLLWHLKGRLRPEGALFLVYLCAYSFGRMFISVLRVNDPFLFGLKQAQVISIVVLVVAVPLLIWLFKRPTPELAEAATEGEEGIIAETPPGGGEETKDYLN